MSKSEFEVIDIESILQCRENEVALLQRLSTYTIESRLEIKASIQKYIIKCKESINKREQFIETVGQLYNKNKEIESQLENVLLQQKVIKKKISNSIKIEDKLKEEIEEGKIKKEKLILEMVDLQQELDQNKTEKKKQWNAIKKGSSYYKDHLNIHIGLKVMNDHDSVTINFFKREYPDKDNFYVVVSNYQNTRWRVDQITPTLKDHELKKLNLNFSTDYNLHEITTFLWQIRKIFDKYYLRPQNS